MEAKLIKDYLGYVFFRLGIWTINVLPDALMKSIIDKILNIVSYRKTTILDNLKMSFPHKTEYEIKSLIKKFYKNLSSVFVSQANGANGDHINYTNIDYINFLMEKYGTILLIGSHFSCWEATGKGITKLLNTSHQYVAYKRVKNKYVDQYIKKMRSNTIATPIEMKKLYRQIIFNKRNHKTSAYYLIADQYPSSLQNMIELNFLNQNTRFINGPEKIATSLDIPVIFLYHSIDIEQNISVKGKLIFEPSVTEQVNISKLIRNQLESQIRANPSYWLWSHKRWKNLR